VRKGTMRARLLCLVTDSCWIVWDTCMARRLAHISSVIVTKVNGFFLVLTSQMSQQGWR
jgi:hypothetical protein